MKPAPFDYVRAETVDQVTDALREAGAEARILAGGQSLIPMLNMRLARPAVLIDLLHVRELQRTDRHGDAIRIGAAVRQAELQRLPDLRRSHKLLAAALPWVGHAQTRSRGTVCGSIAHADPSAELPLVLLALGGEVHLRSRRGARRVPGEVFFSGMMTTARRDDEFIEAVLLPAARPGHGYAFREVARRHGDFAIVACAAVVKQRIVPPRHRRGCRPASRTRASDRRLGAGRGARRLRLGTGRARRHARDRRLSARTRAPRRPRGDRGGRRAPRLSAAARHRVRFTLNGRPVEGEAEPRLLLSDFLRHVLGATGTHVGCEHGICGACTVQIDGAPARACLALAVQVEGAEIRTIEGLAPSPGRLSVLQEAFREHHALQCGFCTAGILMSLDALLRESETPTELEIRAMLSGHLCRCTGYTPIVRAALAAAARPHQDKGDA